MTGQPRLVRTARAEEDLIDVWTYVAQFSPVAADRLLGRIDSLCARLAEHPRMGPRRDDIAPELRYFLAGAYLILYREIEDGAEIVRVLHGSRDLPNLF